MISALIMPEAPALEVKAQIRLAPLTRSHRPPSLGRKQGWLTVSNRDWNPYILTINGDDLFLRRDGGGGVVIPSGATVTIALGKDTYDLHGEGGELKVRIRESRTTILSLEPFGYVGSTGLTGVVNDGDRVSKATLFNSFSPPVVIHPPPPIIVRPPADRPPPAVVRPPAHRPPPHGRPERPGNRPGGKRDDGWSIIFNFGKK
jgi:hypothetical protein